MSANAEVPVPEFRVVVYKRRNDYRVRPAAVAVRPNVDGKASLTFRNLTNDAIQVFLPQGDVFGAGNTFAVQAGDASAPFVITPAAAARNSAYAVYSTEARDFCDGESSPDVIIDR